MPAPVVTSDPPRGYFSVWQRLMRGYGPLAVFAVMIALLSVLVPSKVPDTDSQLASGDVGTGVIEGTDGAAAADEGATAEAAGDAAGGAGAGDAAAAAAGKAAGCPDRELQVPGDPYSPPCVAFAGSNGGATHKGVSGTSIKVAYRVLDERGFQQTLADLAGAS